MMDWKHENEMSEREQEFVKTESDFINGGLSHREAVAEAMANDHRYLVGQKGQLYIEFLKVLAKYERKGWYDPRDEFVCKCARVAIDALIEADLLYIPWDERKDFGMDERNAA